MIGAGLSALALAYAGLSALALGIARHHRQVRGHVGDQRLRKACAVAGWSVVAVLVLGSLHHWGAGVGSVTAIATLTAGALAVAGTLDLAPRRLPLYAVFAVMFAVAVPLADQARRALAGA
ncbi:DUF3325 domain-containing protein [Aquisalimonas asiatica]|uniref:DUF3325 domain-containing protein n=1 Tax=Aquisalimonas asiatica TaxID=406100 RepID=A0A1H8TEX0_9GAMM|nr:DUF3325 domain-containing protein [Aquisalimonas asiatica]SEO89038.1 Protein of unknown function [Aquisalimonas asiatica]